MENKKTNNRKIWICLAVVFIIGSILGCMKVPADTQELLKNGLVLTERDIWLRYMESNGLLLILCWVWGYFMPIFPLACLAVGYKAYTITCIGMTALAEFGRKGALFYLSGVVPHNGILMLGMCLASVASAKLPYFLHEDEVIYRRERYIHGARLIPLILLLMCAAYGESVLFTKALFYLRA